MFGSRPVAALPEGRLVFADGSTAAADLVVGADGIRFSHSNSLGLLTWRRPARQFGYRVMIPRKPEELETPAGRAHCENWNGSRRLLYAPCTAEHAYVQLTSVLGDIRGNQVPIDRALWRGLFPHLGWIIDRIPDHGHGDWFEILRLKDWSKSHVAILGDAANAQPPFLGQGGGCSMMSALSLAHMVDREGDVVRGIAAWTQQERRFTEWVQTVSYWYGQLAFMPPAGTQRSVSNHRRERNLEGAHIAGGGTTHPDGDRSGCRQHGRRNVVACSSCISARRSCLRSKHNFAALTGIVRIPRPPRPSVVLVLPLC